MTDETRMDVWRRRRKSREEEKKWRRRKIDEGEKEVKEKKG